ncbi:hypothetical protein LC087_10535 [Bacillus carboniphilus]|uniref:Methyl-accepting chemotaxis protein n=1 Tax=Bacillus carboniphilus TaxID=86663 RepID=A0ABY9JPL3_9BACI|nr:hypothetical protein [Bacillus carboniphilus]WLR41350.1 hypothetical protein LC087_10535 [Bacillus carboniphilus]
MIERTSNELNDIAENGNRMDASIDDIASISQESAAAVEEATAFVQQSNSSMEEIEREAVDLANLSSELNDLINKFE